MCDGVKVKQEYTDSNGTLTTYYYAGGSYELQTDGSAETVRQYYALAGVTAGMREGNTFNYFLTDHLGSVVGVTDSTGAMVSTTRYSPFGDIRTDVGTVSQTDYGYTFQRNVGGMGLLDYKARYYSSLLGRFIQPDTIIPGAGNPQAWNRYSYVNNRPINFNDPSGHMMDDDDTGGCNPPGCPHNSEETEIFDGYDILFTPPSDVDEGYFDPDPVVVDYDEESYDGSGNSSLNNAVGISPIRTGTWVDAAVLFVNVLNYAGYNTNVGSALQRKFRGEPNVYSFLYDTKSVNFAEGYKEIDLTNIVIVNNFAEEITFMTLKFTYTNTSSNYSYDPDTVPIYLGVKPGAALSLDFKSPLIIPDGWKLNLMITYFTRGFSGTTSHTIQP